jgi:hypothetical protein
VKRALTLTFLMMLVAFVLASVPAAQADSNKVLPPHSNAFGKSLAEWQLTYWSWFLGGGSDKVGNVRLMPLPAGTDDDNDGVWVGSMDVAFEPGEAFMLPISMWIGERYEGYPAVPDDAPPAASSITDGTTVITMDGKTLIDSTTEDVSKYWIGPVYFDEPLPYAEPTSYGAVAAVFVEGIGFVHAPMSKGAHTLHLQYRSPSSCPLGCYGYDNTWHITVAR